MNSATLEHMVPRSQGGPNETWNLVMACHRCNTLRQDHCWESFEVRARGLGVDTRLVCEVSVINRRLANQRRKQRLRENACAAQPRVGPLQRWLFNLFWWTRLVPV